ncbi:hypothetical protein [Jiulongibacter sp. NS-SX5]|uniref:hypothetical protein n=1 Tax=Jiulongibacter sp. NS-SX5 TaxID=3463854 RepID=UPI004057E763
MKYLKYILTILIGVYLYLIIQERERNDPLPIFLVTDTTAEEHSTEIEVNVHSMFKPDTSDINRLKKDYSAIWAHLNHLYATNDMRTGKEYYTENFYKQICDGPNDPQEANLTRQDLSHELHIINWSSDNLVCTAIDSNTVFSFQLLEKQSFTNTHHIAMVLLFQGDHWRVEAMRYLNQ